MLDMRSKSSRSLAGLAWVLLACQLSGCVGWSDPAEPRFDFFAEASADDDPWFQKVSEWQGRARALPSCTKMDSFAVQSLSDTGSFP